jgi:hypothetical protein
MARGKQPPKAHPARVDIEIGLAAAALALAAILLGFFVVAPHHWEHAGDLVLLCLGLFLALGGTYVFAQFYVTWLPGLPTPRERMPRVKPGAAHDVAKQLLKEDGLWPRWWHIRRRLGGGLTRQQYEALRAREIAAAQKEAPAPAPAPVPQATPPLPVSTESLLKTLMNAGEQGKKNNQLAEAEALIRRGNQLRVVATTRPEMDSYTRQFQPRAVMAAALAEAVPIQPYDVNAWLESVARFVGQNFAHHYRALHQTPLPKRAAPEVVAALDKNLEVLRLIEKELRA